MGVLDNIDREILRMLRADARTPFSTIAEKVGLSGPAVSDRVQRLQEIGIITRFTIDIDRTQLRSGIPVFVQITGSSYDVNELKASLNDSSIVEHVFITADGSVWFLAHADESRIRESLHALFDSTEIQYEVTLLDDFSWNPSLNSVEFDITCAECGNTVDHQGTTWRDDDHVYHFCCSSCESQFRNEYHRLEEAA